MFGKKKKQEQPLNEDQDLIMQIFRFPWGIMFEDTPQGGIFTKLFPYIAVFLLTINLLLAAIK